MAKCDSVVADKHPRAPPPICDNTITLGDLTPSRMRILEAVAISHWNAPAAFTSTRVRIASSFTRGQLA